MKNKIISDNLFSNPNSQLQAVTEELKTLHPERNLLSIEDWRNPAPYRAQQIMDKNIAIQTFNNSGNLSLLQSILRNPINFTIQPPFFVDVGANIIIDSDVSIGNNVVILDIGPVSIGKGTTIRNSVIIGSVGHKLNPKDRVKYDFGYKTSIGNSVVIGEYSIILPGCEIGDNTIVLPGSVVKGKIPANSIISGCPAKVTSLSINNVKEQIIINLYLQLLITHSVNFHFENLSHNSINSSEFNWIGENVDIMAHLKIINSKAVSLNEGSLVNVNCIFDGTNGIHLCKNAQLAPGVVLVTDTSIFGIQDILNTLGIANSPSGKIIIEPNSWIGAGAIILPGVTVGQGSIVAAGAIVFEDVPENTVIAGRPAKIIKQNIDQLPYWF